MKKVLLVLMLSLMAMSLLLLCHCDNLSGKPRNSQVVFAKYCRWRKWAGKLLLIYFDATLNNLLFVGLVGYWLKITLCFAGHSAYPLLIQSRRPRSEHRSADFLNPILYLIYEAEAVAQETTQAALTLR